MKKITLIIAAVLLSFSSFAQESEKEDFKHVVYRDVKEVISSLAESLKVGTEHVYGVLVTQSIVTSIVFIVSFFIGTILLGVCYKFWSKIELDSYGEVKRGFAIYVGYAIFTGLIGILASMIGLINLDVIITGLVNPEYGAIRTILEHLK